MYQKRFPEELKIEAVRQIIQQKPLGQRQEKLSQTEGLRRLKAELKRLGGMQVPDSFHLGATH